MPKLTTSPKKQAAGGVASGGAPNYALLSPVKVEATTSVGALRVELSLATSAIKAGHKDPRTVQKAKLVRGLNFTRKKCSKIFSSNGMVSFYPR